MMGFTNTEIWCFVGGFFLGMLLVDYRKSKKYYRLADNFAEIIELHSRVKMDYLQLMRERKHRV
jgi:hypothetical protein